MDIEIAKNRSSLNGVLLYEKRLKLKNQLTIKLNLLLSN